MFMSEMFYGCNKLTSLNLENFNTENVTTMGGMFSGCSSLTSLDLSNFNTENVTRMGSMFALCSSLTSLNLSNFNTSNVDNMKQMFLDCKSLTSLDLSNFNTENVSAMGSLFNNCYKLTSLDLSNFNTEHVTDMQYMFSGCRNLKSLNLSSFNTKSVIYMTGMFRYCEKLTSLDLSSFNTKAVRYTDEMFTDSKCLKTIFVTSNFTFSQLFKSSTDMFKNCVNLTGGKGTKYNANKIDRTYARIDGGQKNPGYFSCKHNWNNGVCTECGYTCNHTWDSGVVTTEPTCVNKGIKTFTCTTCNTTKTEDVAALGHDYSTEWTIDIEPTCTKEGSESHHCTRCDAKTGDRPVAKTDHTWDSGVVTTEPTCVNKGIKTFTCTTCNTTKTEDVAALGHELTHVAKKDATTEDFGNIEYWNCSKCKKNFSDSEGTNEITDSTVIPKLAPSIIKGDNQSVTEKEEKALSVTSNASYDDFIEVKVDGTTLDISKYAKAKGSTIITLNSDYVSTLSVGTHTLDVVSKFGTATAHFKVEKKVEITPIPETNKSSTTDKTSTGWDDGGPFTTDKCGNVFDRWNNKIYEANGCNVGGYNLVRTSVIE